MWRVVIERETAKALDRTPVNVQRLVLRKLQELAVDPHARNNNVKKLVGRPGFGFALAIGASSTSYVPPSWSSWS